MEALTSAINTNKVKRYLVLASFLFFLFAILAAHQSLTGRRLFFQKINLADETTEVELHKTEPGDDGVKCYNSGFNLSASVLGRHIGGVCCWTSTCSAFLGLQASPSVR